MDGDKYNSVSVPPCNVTSTNENISLLICALPYEIKPKRASKSHKRFLICLKEKHKKCILNAEKALKDIRKDSELMLEGIAENARAFIAECHKEIINIIKSNTMDYTICQAWNPKYKDYFTGLRVEIVKQTCKIYTKIKELNESLINQEIRTLNKCKTLLKTLKEKMREINYTTPHEQQTRIETFMMQVNHLSLSNYFIYDTLRMDLLKSTIQNEPIWLQQVDKLEEEYAAKREEQLTVQEPMEEIQYNSHIISLEKLQHIVEKFTDELLVIDGEFETIKNLLQKITSSIHDHEEYKLTGLLPEEMRFAKHDYMSIYTCITDSLFDMDYSNVVTDTSMNTIREWSNLITNMKAEISNARNLIVRIISIWEHHASRVQNCDEKFMADLMKFITQTITSDRGIFTELHKCTDKLRIASTVIELKLEMGECKRIIDTIDKALGKKYESYLKYFDKYRKQMSELGEIHRNELNDFLLQQDNYDDVDSTVQRVRGSRVLTPSMEDSRPRMLKMYEAESKAVRNWLFGAAIGIKKAAESCPETVMNIAEEHIEKMTVDVVRISDIQKQLNHEIYQEIFFYIYRIRLMELIYHEKQFLQHLLGINEKLKLLYNSNSSYYEKPLKLLKENVRKWLARVSAATTSQEIQCYVANMRAYKKSCVNKIQDIFNRIEEDKNAKIEHLLDCDLLYLNTMKTFSEGGNYCTQEFQNARTVIAKTDKDIQRERMGVLRFISQEYKICLDVIQDVDVEFMKEVEKAEKPLKFREFHASHMRKTRERLKEETEELLNCNNTLTTYVNHLQKLGSQNIGQIKYLDGFTSNCEYIEKMFKYLYSQLYQSDVFNLRESLFKLHAGSQEYINKRICLDELNVRHNLENILNVSQTNQAFGIVEPLPAGDNYMAKIVRILMESMETLVIHAQEHFTNEQTMKEFMIDNLVKYIYYQMQCDEILVQVIINYMLLLDELVHYATNYYKSSLESFMEIKLSDLHQRCQTFKNKMNKIREQVQVQFELLVRELKPLHGHPNNKNLLESLNIKLDILEDNAMEKQVEMDNLFNEYETIAEENTSLFQEQIDKMDHRLRKCIKCFVSLYAEDDLIFEQLREKLGYFERIMNDGELVVTTSSGINEEILETLNSKLGNLKYGLQVSSTKISGTMHSNWSKISSLKEKYSNTDQSNSLTISNADLNYLLDTFKYNQQKCLQENATSNNIVQICTLWKKVWQNDIAAINALYKVEYYPPPVVQTTKSTTADGKKSKSKKSS